MTKLVALMGKRSLTRMAAVIFVQTCAVFFLAGITARACLLVGVVAAFKHVGLVNIPRDIDVLVAHDLSEIVALRPWGHILG